MSRERSGALYRDPKTSDLYARVRWTDSRGKRQDKKRKSISGTKKEAYQHIKDMLADLDDRGDKAIEGAKLTLKQLIDYYKANYAIEAQYDDQGMKIAGMRSWKNRHHEVKMLLEYFRPDTLVRDISYGDLEEFKIARMRTPVVREMYRRDENGRRTKIQEKRTSQRAISSVHHELTTLKRLFSIARQKRWLKHNPFDDGDPLIKPGEEKKPQMIASKAQEEALLAACDEDERRKHLKPILICAFDTGCRPIELSNLKVEDVDFEDNCIKVVSYKGKRRIKRPFDMTPRVRRNLQKLCEGKNPDDFAFTYKGKQIKSTKRSFGTAKRLATFEGIELNGFRLYDARHTATTRLIRRGMSLEEAGKLMGHAQPSTTWRYMGVTKSTRRKAAELLGQQEDE